MIRFFPQQSIEQWFSRGLLAAAMRFNGDENRIDFRQLLRIVGAQYPAAIGLIVHVQNAKIHGVRRPV